MKRKTNRQTALKLGLLAALAANISYAPLKEIIQTTNLTSETGSATGTGATPTAPAAAAPAAGVESPVTKNGREVGERGYIEVCDGRQKHRVIFRQIDYGGNPLTVAYAQKAEVPDENLIVGRLAKSDGVYSLARREALMKSLAAELKIEHKCPDEAASTSATTVSAAEERRTREELAKEARENEAKVRRCEMKKVRDGRTFEYVALDTDDNEHLRCQIKRLSMLESERDGNGKTRSKSATLAEAEKIVNDKLKRRIKAMLLSKDESKQDDGKELADEAIEALRDLGRGERRIEKLVNLFQGYKAGGETANRSREHEESAGEVRERITAARGDLRRNPGDRAALWQLQLALNEHRSLANQIDYDIYYGPVAALQWHRGNGSLTSADYNDFLAPYDAIKRQMEDMLLQTPTFGVNDSVRRAIGGSGVPGDLYSLRSSMDRGFARSGGGAIGTAYPLTMPNVRSLFGTNALGTGVGTSPLGGASIGTNALGARLGTGISPAFGTARAFPF